MHSTTRFRCNAANNHSMNDVEFIAFGLYYSFTVVSIVVSMAICKYQLHMKGRKRHGPTSVFKTIYLSCVAFEAFVKIGNNKKIITYNHY